jgi:hypothetical protein
LFHIFSRMVKFWIIYCKLRFFFWSTINHNAYCCVRYFFIGPPLFNWIYEWWSSHFAVYVIFIIIYWFYVNSGNSW